MDHNLEYVIAPTTVRLEASTICQLKCSACATSSQEIQKELGAGFLRFADFKAFTDRYPEIERMELSNWGEMFLNKELLKIMKYARQRRLALSAFNGVNLNYAPTEVLKGLVLNRFSYLSCSIDGASKETYAKYRVGGNFAQVIDNIRTLNHYKQKYRSFYPELSWQFVAFGHNEHEIIKAKQMAAELNMRFHLKLNWEGLYTNNNFSPIKDLELIRRESGLGVANRNEYREKYGREYNHVCCLHMWRDPQINYDGRVLGCSVNYWDDYGNAFLSDLNHCLNRQKMQTARKVLLGIRIQGENIPCYQCNLYKMRAAHGTWVREEEIAKSPQDLAIIRLKRMVRRFALGRRLLSRIREWKHRLIVLNYGKERL